MESRPISIKREGFRGEKKGRENEKGLGEGRALY